MRASHHLLGSCILSLIYSFKKIPSSSVFFFPWAPLIYELAHFSHPIHKSHLFWCTLLPASLPPFLPLPAPLCAIPVWNAPYASLLAAFPINLGAKMHWDSNGSEIWPALNYHWNVHLQSLRRSYVVPQRWMLTQPPSSNSKSRSKGL